MHGQQKSIYIYIYIYIYVCVCVCGCVCARACVLFFLLYILCVNFILELYFSNFRPLSSFSVMIPEAA